MTRCEPDNCGSSCCSPVMLPYTQAYVRDFMEVDARTLDWVLNDLTRIPNREGYARAPWYRAVNMARDPAGIDPAFPLFYECRHYDPDANRCMNYEDRPDPCRIFPWADGRPNAGAVLAPTCSFNADVGREVEVRIR